MSGARPARRSGWGLVAAAATLGVGSVVRDAAGEPTGGLITIAALFLVLGLVQLGAPSREAESED